MWNDDSTGMVKFPSQVEIAGIVVALLPFICTYTNESTRTVNGVVVEHSKTDYAAIVLGAIAIVLGLYIAVTLLNRTDEFDRTKRYAAIAAIVVIGVAQIVWRGFGMV